MRKKFLPLIMAAIMLILGLGITDTTEVAAETDTSTVTITKTLTATGLEDTTFSFTVEEVGYTDTPSSVSSQPEIDDFTITVSKDEKTGTYTINLPTYTAIGVYTYKIKEVAGSVVGVTTYSTAELYLVVTVTNESGTLTRSAVVYLGDPTNKEKNENKEFKNTYNAGSLTVSKEVAGNLGDTTKEFDVTVTFTKTSGTTINSTISYTVGTATYTIKPNDWSGDTATATITVKDDSSVTFTNIPYNVSYTVKEDDYTTNDGYTTTYSGDGGTTGTGTMDSSAETVNITNTKNSSATTGVLLDSLPYILILAVVLFGVVYLVIRRRSSDID